MPYVRVLPRDLFNEANLLKCYGHLWIALERINLKNVSFSVDEVDFFDIRQDQSDGSIFIQNVKLVVDGKFFHLTRPLNSRESYPLYIDSVDDPDFEPFEVFNENGALSERMTALIYGRD